MITEEMRGVVFDKSNGQCHYCGKKLAFNNRTREGWGAWEVEHSHPRALGGTDHLNNLVAACWSCNLDKGTYSARAHRMAVALALEARISKRRWKTTEKALLPAAIAASVAYFFMKMQSSDKEKLGHMPQQEQNSTWKDVLVPVLVGLGVIVAIVIVREVSRKV